MRLGPNLQWGGSKTLDEGSGSYRQTQPAARPAAERRRRRRALAAPPGAFIAGEIRQQARAGAPAGPT